MITLHLIGLSPSRSGSLQTSFTSSSGRTTWSDSTLIRLSSLADASFKMGGGPDKEFLLITNYEPEPVEQLKLIGERFPYIDITYHQTSTHFGDGEGEDKQKMAGKYKHRPSK